MNRFLITGMGRSGTMFLAHTLNRAPGWQVEHEPKKGFHPLSDALDRFSRESPENYGESNSFLRFQALSLFHQLPDLSLAVVIRDPVEIFSSMAARGKPKGHIPNILHLRDGLQAIDAMVQAGVPILSFSRMTTDPIYLSRFASVHFGLTLDPSEISLNPVNATPKEDRVRIKGRMLERLLKSVAWFHEIYHHDY